jgi:hypothetical protein
MTQNQLGNGQCAPEQASGIVSPTSHQVAASFAEGKMLRASERRHSRPSMVKIYFSECTNNRSILVIIEHTRNKKMRHVYTCHKSKEIHLNPLLMRGGSAHCARTLSHRCFKFVKRVLKKTSNKVTPTKTPSREPPYPHLSAHWRCTVRDRCSRDARGGTQLQSNFSPTSPREQHEQYKF